MAFFAICGAEREKLILITKNYQHNLTSQSVTAAQAGSDRTRLSDTSFVCCQRKQSVILRVLRRQ